MLVCLNVSRSICAFRKRSMPGYSCATTNSLLVLSPVLCRSGSNSELLFFLKYFHKRRHMFANITFRYISFLHIYLWQVICLSYSDSISTPFVKIAYQTFPSHFCGLFKKFHFKMTKTFLKRSQVNIWDKFSYVLKCLDILLLVVLPRLLIWIRICNII